MRTASILAASFLGASLLAACGLEPVLGTLEPEPDATEPGLMGAADGGVASSGDAGRRTDGGPRADAGPGGAFDAGGTPMEPGPETAREPYAIQIVIGQTWTMPVLGTQDATMTMLARADVGLSGEVLSIDAKLCDLGIAYGGSLTPVFPQATVDAIPNIRSTTPVTSQGSGLAFSFGPLPVIAGWSTPDAAAALPIAESDARVLDQDADGNPGITLNLVRPGIITGSVYLAFRASLRFSGMIENLDRVTGTNASTTEQAILRATSGLVPTGLVDSVPKPEANRFAMVRMPAGAGSCDAIRAQAAALFP